MSPEHLRIGFIGVGLMGHGVAKNLLEKGFPLTVVGHRNRVPVDDLVKRGALEAHTAAEAARENDVVFVCLTGSPQVEEAFYRPDGILAGAHDGLIVVDASTSEPDSTLRLGAELAQRGGILVDAPLTRTPVEAEAGKANTMVGAAPEIFEKLKPVLNAYCENVFHVGGPGAGHKLKLINNFMVLGMSAIIAEAITTAAKAGVDIEKLYDVVSAGPMANGLLRNLVPKAIAGEFDGMKFQLANGQKDLRYYTHMAETLGVTSFMGETVHQTFVLASCLGFGTSYVPSLIEAQAKLNGVAIESLRGKEPRAGKQR